MRGLISFLGRFLAPAAAMVYFGVGIVLLAVSEQKKVLFLSLLWTAGVAALLYGGVYGILTLARRRTNPKELMILVRGTEIAEVILVTAAAILAVLLYDVPSAANLLPVALFGLGGTFRFDTKYLK